MAESVYCKCKNKYIVKELCDCKEVPDYWRQRIGKTEASS